jgi:hypothetical protein
MRLRSARGNRMCFFFFHKIACRSGCIPANYNNVSVRATAAGKVHGRSRCEILTSSLSLRTLSGTGWFEGPTPPSWQSAFSGFSLPSSFENILQPRFIEDWIVSRWSWDCRGSSAFSCGMAYRAMGSKKWNRLGALVNDRFWVKHNDASINRQDISDRVIP